jgi:hypothetical protein
MTTTTREAWLAGSTVAPVPAVLPPALQALKDAHRAKVKAQEDERERHRLAEIAWRVKALLAVAPGDLGPLWEFAEPYFPPAIEANTGRVIVWCILPGHYPLGAAYGFVSDRGAFRGAFGEDEDGQWVVRYGSGHARQYNDLGEALVAAEDPDVPPYSPLDRDEIPF